MCARLLLAVVLWRHHTASFQPPAPAGALGGNPGSRDQALTPKGGFRIPVLGVNIIHWEPACGSEPLLLPADVPPLLPCVLLSTSPVETFPPRLLFLEGACDGLRSPGSAPCGRGSQLCSRQRKGVHGDAVCNTLHRPLSCSNGCCHARLRLVALTQHRGMCLCLPWAEEGLFLNTLLLLSWRNTTCLKAELLTAAAFIMLCF